MKTPAFVCSILLVASAALTGCASRKSPPPAPTAAAEGKSVVRADGKGGGEDDLDTYAIVPVSDPIEPLNRATFWINDGVYTVLLRPISKGYETITPKLVRDSVYNAFENVKFPVRFVNNLLQGNFPRAGQETGKFFVNTVVGIGGLGRPAEHIPALANVPPADTAQTFAKWGIGTGPYLVLPILGPSTVRDAVGLAGDYALNPITWVSFVYGDYVWIVAIPASNTLRALPSQMNLYDSITKDSLDRYLAARSAYIQNRREINSR